jgi:acetylornithine deacetylase/succinyl-diaminopimelate desuccinylase-like protein
MPDLLDQLIDWLRIPSISTGGGDPADLRRAAEWAAAHVERAGGAAELIQVGDGNPLVVGDLRAAHGDAPTVLIYGHYDVQGAGDLSAWTTPPFEPDVRDGRLYARGAADDKGNFWPLLAVACELAASGELPVNVRVVVEGEEEAGSESIAEWIRADERGADAAIVFDSGMVDERTPAITVGLRGMLMAQIQVRTGTRDLHSGIYGGSVLNALHVLHGMLAEVVPGPDGRLREELRAGITAPSQAERDSWTRLPPGEHVLAEVGGRPAYRGAAGEYYERNGADASLDVNEVVGGEPRTLVPAAARAAISLRLAPGQRAAEIGAGAGRAAARRGARGSRGRARVAPGGPGAVRARPAGPRARRPGDRARDRHAAGARAQRRIDPRRRRVRGALDPDDRHRLRPPGRRLPRARRVLPAREPRPRRAHRPRAAHRARGAVTRGLR